MFRLCFAGLSVAASPLCVCSKLPDKKDAASQNNKDSSTLWQLDDRGKVADDAFKPSVRTGGRREARPVTHWSGPSATAFTYCQRGDRGREIVDSGVRELAPNPLDRKARTDGGK